MVSIATLRCVPLAVTIPTVWPKTGFDNMDDLFELFGKYCKLQKSIGIVPNKVISSPVDKHAKV
jgi:hypothetical protein